MWIDWLQPLFTIFAYDILARPRYFDHMYHHLLWAYRDWYAWVRFDLCSPSNLNSVVTFTLCAEHSTQIIPFASFLFFLPDLLLWTFFKSLAGDGCSAVCFHMPSLYWRKAWADLFSPSNREGGGRGWSILIHQCHVDPVDVVDDYVEHAKWQLWAPSMLPTLSHKIILGLHTIPLVNLMEHIQIANVLLWTWNISWLSFLDAIDLPFPCFDASFNYLWGVEMGKSYVMWDVPTNKQNPVKIMYWYLNKVSAEIVWYNLVQKWIMSNDEHFV